MSQENALEKSGSAIPTLLQQKSTMVRAVAAGGGIVFLALALPVIGAALSAALGLIGLGLAAVVGIGAFQLLPYIGQRWENKVLALRKAEARANPIEQLENRYQAKDGKVKEARAALELLASNAKAMARMIEERKKANPNHDLSAVKKSYEAMAAFVRLQAEKVAEAELRLASFKELIGQKRFEYEFAVKGQVAIGGLRAAKGDDPLQALLEDESIRSIETQFDTVFASIELDAVLEQAKQVKGQTGDPLDAIDAEFETLKK